MVELLQNEMRDDHRQSSKGNQLKWKQNNIWYKADYTGYEGLSEYIISHLIQKSTLGKKELLGYETEKIKYKNQVFNGCRSNDFLTEGMQMITLERLFQHEFGTSLHKSIYSIQNHEDRLIFLVNQTERITGLTEFGVYMSKMMTIDALFLNEDRHTHNIAVLLDEDGTFHYCPYFDHGAGLLSDTTMDYPFSVDVEQLIQTVQSKTFASEFDEQLDIAEKLYGTHLKFNFDRKNVEELIQKDDVYGEIEKKRIMEIMTTQIRKYKYLFI